MAWAWVLGGVVTVSLVAVAGYAVLFAVTAFGTALRRPRHDPLEDELDRVLAEILGRPPEAGAHHLGRGRAKPEA